MRLVYLIALSLVLAALSQSYLPSRDQFPQIISHRGASGYIPEHSIGAYQTAVDLLTDYVEPDLCLSKDGVFVVMHDVLLDDTTDIASHPEFADRKTTKTVDGVSQSGYFISDFLFSELETLRLKQRMSIRTTVYNWFFQIQRFDDVLKFAQNTYASTGRMIGVYPELKHPAFFNSLGFQMEDMFLDVLTANGYAINGENAFNDLSKVVPVVIQCFDPRSLVYLKDKTSLPKILLMEYPQLTAPKKDYASVGVNDLTNSSYLKEIAAFASGIGPDKLYFSGSLAVSKEIVAKSHEAGLRLHPWTFRADSGILDKFQGNFAAELQFFYFCLGIDALFIEFPDRAREVLDNFATAKPANYCVE